MKKIIIAGSLFTIILILFISALFATDFKGAMEIVMKVSPGLVIAFILLSFINFALYTLRWDIIAHAGRERVAKFWSMVGIRYVTYAIGYLLPSAQIGGEPVRMYFLEKRGFSRKEALSSVIIDKVFETAIVVIFAVIAFVLVIFYAQGVPTEIYSFFMLFLILLLFFAYFYYTIVKDGFFTFIFQVLHLKKIKFLAPLEEKIMSMEALMKRFFHHHVKELLWTIALTMLTYIVFLLEYYLLFFALGVKPTFGQLIVVSTIPLISYLIPIPGAAGALELSQYLSLSLAKMDPNLAFPIMVIIRLRDLFFIIAGLVYGSTHGVKLLSKGSD